jgi:hypothetical protein
MLRSLHDLWGRSPTEGCFQKVAGVAAPAPEVRTEREKDGALARDLAFRDLESEVCDLDRMGEIAERLVAEWMGGESSSPPREAELAVCAVQQLRKFLTEFKTQYYRAWEGS